jgi:hypothetical protein
MSLFELNNALSKAESDYNNRIELLRGVDDDRCLTGRLRILESRIALIKELISEKEEWLDRCGGTREIDKELISDRFKKN